MEISEQLANQIKEALGPVNRWFCSQFYGYEVQDHEVLLCYYIKHGGAEFFRNHKCSQSAQK